MPDRTFNILVVLVVIVVVLIGFLFNNLRSKDGSSIQMVNDTSDQTQAEPSATPTPTKISFNFPLTQALDRVTKKRFGTYVEPGNSPVSPEKFRGYHTGVDFEILSSEENSDVQITAICDGILAIKRTASGYGGLVAQYCVLSGSDVLVVYGHVRLSSVSQKIGDEIKTGDKLAFMGTPGPETDGERKHLHLGIHKGKDLNIAGYVQTESALSGWIDPLTVLK